MLCPTPAIDLPPEFASALARRRKRDTSLADSSILPRDNHLDESGHRIKRQVDITDSLGYQLNSDSLQFYIGFQLDGVMTYKNLSEALPQMGILNVFTNPEFEEFDDEVTNYRPYWPFDDDKVDVKVS